MEKVKKRLFELQDLKYRDFNAKLIPNIDKEKVIGVRTPAIKAFAKELENDPDKMSFLKELPHQYQEENSLHSFLVNSISKDIYVVLQYIEEFLPYIDNWAVCDSMKPKIFAKYPDIIYPYLVKWTKSNDTYTIRFGVVSLLQFFLDDQFKPEINDLVASIKSDEYYVNMAIAWYFSFALIKQCDTTIKLIESRRLSKWIQNKSIQKAIESYRVSDEKKEYLRSLKIR